MNVKVIGRLDEYDSKKWFRNAAFREANRCFHCYADRLERTLSLAKRGGFDFYTTTLLYSKFQQHERIAELGKDMAGMANVNFTITIFEKAGKRVLSVLRKWESIASSIADVCSVKTSVMRMI